MAMHINGGMSSGMDLNVKAYVRGLSTRARQVCPICKQVLTSGKMGITMHLTSKHKEINKHVAYVIGSVAANRKGCNHLLDTLKPADREYVVNFIAESRGLRGQTHEPRPEPV